MAKPKRLAVLLLDDGELDDEELEDITETLPPPPEQAPVSQRANPGEADTRVILQALTQLLIEARVIDREALIDRISRLDARLSEDGS